MFDNNVHRIGFACKYMHPKRDTKKALLEDIERRYNGRATTKAWLSRQSATEAEKRMHEIVDDNIKAYARLIEYVGTLDPRLRMLRLGSDVLPMFTEDTWGKFYTPDVLLEIERKLSKVGERARELDIKLSMHPGQFTVLASDDPSIVTKSIEEMEYHALVASYMGYAREFQDFKINVHISGRRGPAGVRDALRLVSPEVRRTITIENEENRWGVDDILELADKCALVLDVHHHWCHSGDYIQPTDDRYKRIVDSWRGVRPTMHYSVSREDYLVDHDGDTLPDFNALLAAGYKKQKLRAHSDFMWNRAVNDYVAEFWPHTDIMVESKAKNLASIKLFEEITGP